MNLEKPLYMIASALFFGAGIYVYVMLDPHTIAEIIAWIAFFIYAQIAGWIAFQRAL